MPMRNSRYPWRTDRRAQTLIEFALSFPIILVFFMGMLEIGWIEFNQTASLNAAREAARAGALGENDATVTSIAQAGAYGLPITQVLIRETTLLGAPVAAGTRATGNILYVETVIAYQPIGLVFNFLPNARITQLSATAAFMINND